MNQVCGYVIIGKMVTMRIKEKWNAGRLHDEKKKKEEKKKEKEIKTQTGNGHDRMMVGWGVTQIIQALRDQTMIHASSDSRTALLVVSSTTLPGEHFSTSLSTRGNSQDT